jgi:hypothetical protein
MMDDNKLNIIEQCLIYCAFYVKNYSAFISKALKSNVELFVKNEGKSRYIKSINNNINSIEGKITDVSSLVDDLKKLIKSSYKSNLSSSEYSRYLCTLVDEDNLLTIVNNLLNEYAGIVKKNKPKKEKIVLPKKDKDKVRKISYLKLNDLIYVHMKAIDEYPFMSFVVDSFMLENDMFYDSLKEGKMNIFNDLDRYEISKLAPLEKKRRNYVRNMFKILSSINKLEYDCEEYYKVSSDIINNLYAEVNDFNFSNSSVDKLLRLTKEAYGGKKQLELYKEKLSKVDTNNIIKRNFVNKYVIFDASYDVIPLYEDVIRILNEKLIDRVSFNINNYLKNMDKVFDQVCMYMDSDEVLRFYFEFKNVLNAMSLNKNMKNKYIELQKYGCNKLEKMLRTSRKNVLANYLKEEKIF